VTDFLNQINRKWTLFLDRDGVINKRPPNDYVKTWDEFEFLPGVLEALKILALKFSKIIIITNQQGIGKNVMTTEDLQIIHDNLIQEVSEKKGRIDAIYFCPDLAIKAVNCRKPNINMAKQAKIDYPDIDFSISIMVGDTLSDMQFGENAGMKTVFINTNNSPLTPLESDHCFPGLLEFAKAINTND